MKNCKLLIALLGVPMLVSVAAAGPIVNGCQLNNPADANQGFTCDLYDIMGGNPSDISDIAVFPSTQGPGGWLVIYSDQVAGDPNNPATWSDALFFTTTGVQLFSEGCNVAPGDTSCFPTPANVGFYNGTETPPITVYNSIANPNNHFNVHEASEAPEPATLALSGLGLIGVGLIARKRRK